MYFFIRKNISGLDKINKHRLMKKNLLNDKPTCVLCPRGVRYHLY